MRDGEGNRVRHSPGFYKRLVLLLVASDLGRAAVSLLAMGLAFLAESPLWLTLVVPVMVYLGLWLIASKDPPPQLLPNDPKGDFKACLEIRGRLVVYAAQLGDAQTSGQLQGIVTQLDRILGVIDEDKKFDSTTPLLSLLGITDDLLEKYSKVTRRGLDDAKTRDAVKESLETLLVSYQEFWGHLNRYVIVDLDALTQMIRELLQRLASPQDVAEAEAAPTVSKSEPEPTEPSDQSSVFDSAVSPNGHGKCQLLTRRELEVLCLLPMTTRQISEELFIEPRTVEKHIENICAKFEVETRTAAAMYSVNHCVCRPKDSNGGADHAS